MILLLATVTWLDVQLERWNKSEIRPEKRHYVEAVVSQIKRNQRRYEIVDIASGVPWQVIASIHNMECSLSFNQNLANGDSIRYKTRHVPKARPPGKPPFTWEYCAIDALQYDRMGYHNWRGVSNILQNIEAYNGTGYQRFHPDVPSPYLWSWTNLYVRGKYVADGKWSDTAISDQCGVVPILKLLP